ncbi:hypothetical protein B0H10DRAFT_2194101 [Mycena sp. CBHHK59/15]|nr:hypothetical protein B0H10DRAFT_2194101 [Mycena sp. CBHHK59/15]
MLTDISTVAASILYPTAIGQTRIHPTPYDTMTSNLRGSGSASPDKMRKDSEGVKDEGGRQRQEGWGIRIDEWAKHRQRVVPGVNKARRHGICREREYLYGMEEEEGQKEGKSASARRAVPVSVRTVFPRLTNVEGEPCAREGYMPGRVHRGGGRASRERTQHMSPGGIAQDARIEGEAAQAEAEAGAGRSRAGCKGRGLRGRLDGGDRRRSGEEERKNDGQAIILPLAIHYELGASLRTRAWARVGRLREEPKRRPRTAYERKEISQRLVVRLAGHAFRVVPRPSAFFVTHSSRMQGEGEEGFMPMDAMDSGVKGRQARPKGYPAERRRIYLRSGRVHSARLGHREGGGVGMLADQDESTLKDGGGARETSRSEIWFCFRSAGFVPCIKFELISFKDELQSLISSHNPPQEICFRFGSAGSGSIRQVGAAVAQRDIICFRPAYREVSTGEELGPPWAL